MLTRRTPFPSARVERSAKMAGHWPGGGKGGTGATDCDAGTEGNAAMKAFGQRLAKLEEPNTAGTWHYALAEFGEASKQAIARQCADGWCTGAMSTMVRYLAFALLVIAIPAQAQVRSAVASIDVRPDGSSVQTFHVALQAANDAAAQRIAQQPIVYSASREELTILEAYTQKSDGTRLNVDADAIHAQLLPGSSNFPLFNDQNRKVVVFPSVAAGDTIVYTARRGVHRPLFPGHFTWQVFLDRSVSWHDYRVTITAPANMPLHVEQHGIEVERHPNDNQVVYRFHAAFPNAVVEGPAAVGPFQRLPRAFASSMPDYATMARAYAVQSLPREAVTSEIQRLADRLTDGVTDRKDQARLIYNWVSTHIRYVAIWLGQGVVEPHTAFNVLAVGYGDCKDHAVLFGALLKARGIDSEPVLINSGNEYLLPGPPTLAVLNHVITWLPEFALYVDTTAEVAPFGVLPFQEYGKPVVHASATAPVERQTPVILPGQATESFVNKATLAPDGTIEGESTTVGSGPFSIALRFAAKNIGLQGQQRAAQAQLKSQGEEGSGSFDFPPVTNIDGDYSVIGRFHLDPKPELLDGTTFPLPVGLRLLVRPGDLLLGPLGLRDLKDTEPTPCHAGKQIEKLSLTLPEGWRVARVPKDVRIDNALLHYETHWSVSPRLVSVERELASFVPGPICDGETRRQTAQALLAIRRDLNAQIGLSQD
jgi:transglutaminase-like putative cysteine protease